MSRERIRIILSVLILTWGWRWRLVMSARGCLRFMLMIWVVTRLGLLFCGVVNGFWMLLRVVVLGCWFSCVWRGLCGQGYTASRITYHPDDFEWPAAGMTGTLGEWIPHS